MSDQPDSQPRISKPASKAPPPLPKRTSTMLPARTPNTHFGQGKTAHATDEAQESKGLIAAIQRKLPAFRYQATAPYRRLDAQMHVIADAIQDRLPGCQVVADENGTIVVKNIDRYLDLGVFDKWITMNWHFREVDARITLSNQGQSPVLVADIDQTPSSNFAIFAVICVPCLFVGWLAFGFQLIYTNLAKETIRSAVQRLLNDVAQST